MKGHKYTVDDIYRHIIRKLDASIEFADDRNKLVVALLEANPWIYNEPHSMESSVKQTKAAISPAPRQQSYVSCIEQIATYIIKGKLRDEQKQGQSTIKVRTVPVFYQDRRVEYVEDMACREMRGDYIVTEEQAVRQKRLFKAYKQPDLDQNYFDRMFLHHTEEGKRFRLQCLQVMQDTLDRLGQYIGLHISDKSERQSYIQSRLAGLQQSSDRGRVNQVYAINHMSDKRQFAIIRAMYNDLKGNYQLAKKQLSNELQFRKKSRHSTSYNINEDTCYTENGQLIQISKNRVLLSDSATYRGLIMNYRVLKGKYKNSVDSDLWALLLVFEDILKNTKFTPVETFVINGLLQNYTQKEICNQFQQLQLGFFTKDQISRMINIIIPRKLQMTYLNDVEEWLYTEKLKGRYKQCAQCREIKLLNQRHFGIDRRMRDGYKSYCRSCERSTRKITKKIPDHDYIMRVVKLK